MSYKAITIYSAEDADPHISAADDAFIYDSLAGGRSGVMGELTCTRVDDTTVRLSGGGVSNKGYILRIPGGASHDLTVDTGTQSLRRHDLVISEFIKGGDGIADVHVLRIEKGVASTLPTDPPLFTSNLIARENINQVPLFRIVLNGLAIEDIQLVAPSAAAGEYICCKGTDAAITPVSGEITQVPLTSVGMISCGRCLSVKNGTVVCAVDGTVEVTGSVYMQGNPASDRYHACYIMQNGAELTPGIRPVLLYGAVSAPPQILRVNAGDVLTLHCRTTADNGSCLGGDKATWLSVKYIG